MPQIIKIYADYFLFFLAQRHQDHKEVGFTGTSFVPFVPL